MMDRMNDDDSDSDPPDIESLGGYSDDSSLWSLSNIDCIHAHLLMMIIQILLLTLLLKVFLLFLIPFLIKILFRIAALLKIPFQILSHILIMNSLQMKAMNLLSS